MEVVARKSLGARTDATFKAAVPTERDFEMHFVTTTPDDASWNYNYWSWGLYQTTASQSKRIAPFKNSCATASAIIQTRPANSTFARSRVRDTLLSPTHNRSRNRPP